MIFICHCRRVVEPCVCANTSQCCAYVSFLNSEIWKNKSSGFVSLYGWNHLSSALIYKCIWTTPMMIRCSVLFVVIFSISFIFSLYSCIFTQHPIQWLLFFFFPLFISLFIYFLPSIYDVAYICKQIYCTEICNSFRLERFLTYHTYKQRTPTTTV